MDSCISCQSLNNLHWFPYRYKMPHSILWAVAYIPFCADCGSLPHGCQIREANGRMYIPVDGILTESPPDELKRPTTNNTNNAVANLERLLHIDPILYDNDTQWGC